ncbi:unnamed protein product [Medioppia subpectinata]|uniref:C2H2-type domain-containing protein n=1 Tax=Medioppia subpectinata TaxID=1979941 RepID=A0A7R9Q840_9ACAR|nr:unnamed protein product [Medioppia subpectinata]CAG2116393.1 unnamed protein product [Medioppia subpectinata]
MAKIVMNDVFKDMTRENDRLLRELRFSLRSNELMEKYRQLSLDFRNTCICEENIGNESKFNDLEIIYNTIKAEECLHRQQIEEQVMPVIGSAAVIASDDDYSANEEEYNKTLAEDMDTSGDEYETNLTDGHEFDDNIEEENKKSSGEDICDVLSGEYESPILPKKRRRQKKLSVKASPKNSGTNCRTRSQTKKTLKEKIVSENESPRNGHSADDNNESIADNEDTEELGSTAGERWELRCDYDNCRKSFTLKGNLKKHQKTVHSGERPYRCSWPDCGAAYKTKDSLGIHEVKHSKGGQYKCPFEGCDKSFGSDRDLRIHSRSHKTYLKSYNNYACDWEGCDRRFTKRDDLLAHVSAAHTNDKPYQCPDCDKRFAIERLLKSHQRYHRMCEQKTVDSGDASRDQRCDCIDCGKSFKTRRYLNKHRRYVHTDHNLWSCDWPDCTVATRSENDLIEHKNRHQKIKPFVCETVGCPMRYYSTYELKQHVMRAHNVMDRNYNCDIDGCRLSYATEHDLRRHKRRHDRIYRCSWPECGQSYSAKVLLSEHMDRHNDVKSHKCLYVGCGKQFFSKNNCKTHMKNVHKKVK